MSSDSTPRRRIVWFRRTVRWVVRPLIVLFLLLEIGFYLFQEFKVFEPSLEPTGYVDMPELKPVREDVFLELDEARTRINYQKFLALTQSSKGTVFFLHGNRGSIYHCRWDIEPFLKAGYDVWTMDYRGYGKSTGDKSEAALLADAQMVYKRIIEEEGEREIIVWGRSFGSGVAAFIASGNSPKALVLETPYWSLPDAACHSHPYLFPFLFRYKLPTHDFLCNSSCPIYLIHGTADEKIYSESSKRLEQLCIRKQKEIHVHWVKDGKHNLRSEAEFHAFVKDVLQ